MISLITITHIYLNGKLGYLAHKNTTELQETGRLVMQTLTRHIQRSGYMGNFILDPDSVKKNTNNSTNPDCYNQDWVKHIETAIIGLNQNQRAYTCLNNPGSVYRITRGDVITLRYAEVNRTTTVKPGNSYLASSMGKYSLVPDKKPAESNMQLNRLRVFTFFPGQSSRPVCNQKKGPALIALTISNSGKLRRQALINGVEKIQYQYGELIDPANQKVVLRNADSVTNWNQVISVKIWALIRADCPQHNHADKKQYRLADILYQPNDRYHRQLFTTTVLLKNRLKLLKAIKIEKKNADN